MPSLAFETRTVPINALGVKYDKNEQRPGTMNALANTTISLDGESFNATRRFWTSVGAQFGLSPNVFNYFLPKEVLNRVAEKTPKHQVRVVVEKKDKTKSFLAATKPDSPMIRYDEMIELAERYDGKDVTYHDGMVTSKFRLNNGSGELTIMGDKFHPRISLHVPIDGYGLPNVYLEMLRLVCTNGIVAASRAFRTDISLGKRSKDVVAAVERTIRTYNNDEGYAAFANRLLMANQSWASINEMRRLDRVLHDHMPVHLDNEGRKENRTIHHRFHKLTGEVADMYGITQLDALSERKASTLPCRATVGQLLNFATEVSTHHMKDVRGRSAVSGWVGRTLACELDLEGSVKEIPDFEDFFLKPGSRKIITKKAK